MGAKLREFGLVVVEEGCRASGDGLMAQSPGLFLWSHVGKGYRRGAQRERLDRWQGFALPRYSGCGGWRRSARGQLTSEGPRRDRLRALYGQLSLIRELCSADRLSTGEGKRLSIRIPASAASPTVSSSTPFRLIRSADVKAGQADQSRVFPRILGKAIWMFGKLMSFQIHFCLEDVGLVGLTFRVQAHKMIRGEVLLQLLVIQVVLWLSSTISSVAYVASFMFLSTVIVQFIVAIESLSAKAALRVSFESRLIVAKSLMPSQFSKGE